MKKLSLGALILITLSQPSLAQQMPSGQGGAFSCPEGDDSIACKQKAQIEEIWVDMNKSATYLTDELVQNPQSVIEAGCLDGIMQMDLSVITIDPYGIWNTVYAGIKDQLINMACSAVQDKINEATEYLETKLEAPMGLGSVSLQQRGRVDSFSEIQESRVLMDNSEAKNTVIKEVFDEYPRVRRRQSTEQQIDQRRVQNGGKSTRTQRNENEEKVQAILDVDRIFNNKDEKGDGR